MLSMFLAQTATATPNTDTAFDTRPYIELLNSWQSMSFFMAFLFIVGVALIVAGLLVFYFIKPRSQSQYNAHETLRQEMIRSLADERREKEAVEQEKLRLEALFAEGLSALSDANNRIADNGKLANELMKTRDDEQAKLAAAISTIVNEGSKPLQDMARIINEINRRTTGWDEIIAIIPTLKSKLEALESDAEKHITKPMPALSELQPEMTSTTHGTRP